jgi:ATP-binding cassette subfamily B protein
VAIVALAWPAAVVRLRHARAQLDLLAAHNEAQRDVQYLSGVLTGRGAAKDLRLADAGEQLRSEVSERRAALQTAGLRLSRRRAVADGLAQALQAGAMFAAYAFLGYGALHGGLSLGGLVLHAQAVQRAQSAVRDLLLAAAALREDQLFAAPLRDFLALRSRLPAAAEPTPLPAAPAALALARVHFTYPGQSQPLLRGLDLELRPGEHVALVGRNGAGKSTVVKLLCRLYDPGQGRVQYGGIDLRQLDAAALHRRLSVLFQDAAGFERSVVDNVAFGPGSARDAAAIDVTLAQVGLDAMVSRLPAGPATRLSRRFDGGHEPSAGEWRRLLLARALHRRAEILILDEPSAFLDPPALAALLQHLRTELRGTAVLLADHRLDCVQFADRVCVLEGGVIVEDGAPATLLARRGALAALFGNPVG